MSTVAHVGSPDGDPTGNATPSPHCSIETSGEINEFMKMHVVNLAERGLRQVGKRLYGAKITIMGLAYKKNINDSRESPAIKIIEELANLGADVRVYDPFVQSLTTKAGVFSSAGSGEEALSCAVCAIFLVDHDEFRESSVETVKGRMASPMVVDGKDLFEAGEGLCTWGLEKGLIEECYDIMPLTSKIENLNLAVICHSYNNFQKDQIDILAPRVSSVTVFVRVNPFSELGKYLPIPQIERFSSAYKIDRTGIPENVQVYPTHIWYVPTDRDYKRLGKRHYARVKSLIRKHGTEFNLIHAHFTWSAGYVGARLKEEYDVPFVVTGHGYDIYSLPFKDNEWRKKIEYVLNTADHVITVSQSNLACIKKLDVSTPVTVIPNGFRSDLFYPRNSSECRRVLNLPLNKKIILSVGNLEPVKGHTHLVEAVQKIVRKRKDILCVIVGAGKLRNTLERQIRSLGLDDHIRLAGGKPHNEIPLWMNACDLFVLPSLRESFGVVQIEAMACGKPVVATRNGGSEEVIISDEHGLLVEPANPDDLAEKILMALDQDWDREAILAYAERFTWKRIAEEIVEVYKKVVI